MPETKPAKPEAAPDLKTQLAAATRENGVVAINPNGDLVLLPPGTVKLGADLERGLHIAGLKDGWRLATEADEAKAKTAAAEAEKKNPRDEPSSKKTGA